MGATALLSESNVQAEPTSPLNVDALQNLAVKLRTHIANITAVFPPEPDQPTTDGSVQGWCLASGPSMLLCQALLVQGAKRIEVSGPHGQTSGRVSAYNMAERWAKVVTRRPIRDLGLRPASPCLPKNRKLGMDLFALVTTDAQDGVVVGALVDIDLALKSQGYIRSDLRLQGGMPVFDQHLRWVGLARASIWDQDKTLLISPELVDRSKAIMPSQSPPTSASTTSGHKRPWWAK